MSVIILLSFINGALGVCILFLVKKMHGLRKDLDDVGHDMVTMGKNIHDSLCDIIDHINTNTNALNKHEDAINYFIKETNG